MDLGSGVRWEIGLGFRSGTITEMVSAPLVCDGDAVGATVGAESKFLWKFVRFSLALRGKP